MQGMHTWRSIFLLPACAIAMASAAVAADDPGTVAEFELLGSNGEIVTQMNFRGRYVLLAFGFTNCPHVCPMMAANMAAALKISDRDAAGIFISVDTERDTPDIVQQYASSFHEDMIGLGGSYRQINEATKSFNVTYVVSKSQKNYTVQHTSNIFVIDAEGRIIETFPLNARPGDIAAVLDGAG
jgi:protein SCO1/2